MSDEGLTFKQKAFVQHFTSPETFGNGLRAAQKAGYSGSYSTLGVTAHDNLKNPKVQLAIQKRAKSIMDAEECLTELSTVARVQPTKNSPLNGNHKLKALELVGKAHRLFDDKPASPADELVKMLEALNGVGFTLCPADPTDNSGVIDVEPE